MAEDSLNPGDLTKSKLELVNNQVSFLLNLLFEGDGTQLKSLLPAGTSSEEFLQQNSRKVAERIVRYRGTEIYDDLSTDFWIGLLVEFSEEGAIESVDIALIQEAFQEVTGFNSARYNPTSVIIGATAELLIAEQLEVRNSTIPDPNKYRTLVIQIMGGLAELIKDERKLRNQEFRDDSPQSSTLERRLGERIKQLTILNLEVLYGNDREILGFLSRIFLTMGYNSSSLPREFNGLIEPCQSPTDDSTRFSYLGFGKNSSNSIMTEHLWYLDISNTEPADSGGVTLFISVDEHTDITGKKLTSFEQPSISILVEIDPINGFVVNFINSMSKSASSHHKSFTPQDLIGTYGFTDRELTLTSSELGELIKSTDVIDFNIRFLQIIQNRRKKQEASAAQRD